ncbi:MAG: phosphoribosylanthranilate isomerase [Pseudomonadota bacterium]
MRVKICGLTRPEDVEGAVDAGADYLGFVFFPRSPRALSTVHGVTLMDAVPSGVLKVALTVDPDDALIDQLSELPVDFLQLHGHEAPERISEIKSRSGLPVVKAIGISDVGDLLEIARYKSVADQILVDTKPPKGASRPGGNAVAFDWSLLTGFEWTLPWLLAGGLTSQNVGKAIRITGAQQVDVSSDVESALGIKDRDLMRNFISAAKAA